eukprot:CAMPEP_0201283852 /NCGR_PEP_ID=MMETSP1317-20130820/51291_1 /ASSEMBLY_ACC=CAM_ASM_000770 /TAXON_ID=187299 /ORGANISM="Undescribed Undescribed, Strain Undescribed" /LENGTH=83 /DNA_ID=CAMNT_0047601621 /DNA_START=471 /DNA_END=723 /DNA_ORIENTATION=+
MAEKGKKLGDFYEETDQTETTVRLLGCDFHATTFKNGELSFPESDFNRLTFDATSGTGDWTPKTRSRFTVRAGKTSATKEEFI